MRFALERAHVEILPELFVSLAWLAFAAGVAVGVAIDLLFVALLVVAGAGAPGALGFAVMAAMPVLLGTFAFAVIMLYPDVRAAERRRQIDAHLPYAVNYIAAMSGAGATPALIFKDLARQPVYGEVSREAAWINRDMELFGDDFVSAVNKAIGRTPSLRFGEFLQGAKTTLASGGALKSYFVNKAEQYMGENRRREREFLEGLSILGESYVTVVIAGPLFLIVMLSIMTVVGGSLSSTQILLFLLIFAFLPIAHIVFSFVVASMTPEA